jgi:NAD(P)-dependent dehydrogenase (short-subunit alcohol dehydrogenase family)
MRAMRVIVITGCSSGIGLVTARHLARRSDRVYSLPLDAASPYADHERRVNLMFTNAKQVGSDPQMIAEVIEGAITSNASKLRYPAGVDAAVVLAARARMSDEDWIALGRTMTDEQYFAELTKMFTPA